MTEPTILPTAKVRSKQEIDFMMKRLNELHAEGKLESAVLIVFLHDTTPLCFNPCITLAHQAYAIAILQQDLCSQLRP